MGKAIIKRRDHTKCGRIRELLKANPDGMTLREIFFALNITYTTSSGKLLDNMPDAYIDRWKNVSKGTWSAVWCVADIPEHCPRPTLPKRVQVKP